MNNHYYHQEMLATEHFRDLARDMARERALALLPCRSTLWRRSIGRVGRLLIVLGTRMEGTTKSETQVAYNA